VALGVRRYVLEQTIAQLHQLRRLHIRFHKRADGYKVFVTLGLYPHLL
jgi:hypothetical protein